MSITSDPLRASSPKAANPSAPSAWRASPTCPRNSSPRSSARRRSPHSDFVNSMNARRRGRFRRSNVAIGECTMGSEIEKKASQQLDGFDTFEDAVEGNDAAQASPGVMQGSIRIKYGNAGAPTTWMTAAGEPLTLARELVAV